MRRTTLWLTVLGLAACQGPGVAVSQQDLDFVTYAEALIHFDKQEGQLARTQSRDPAVLAVAGKIDGDADTMAGRVRAAARRAGIAPPARLPNALAVRLAHMRLEQGADFDRNYVRDQIYSHEDNLTGLQEEAAHGTAPELRALAQRAVPIVDENLARLRSLRDAPAERQGLPPPMPAPKPVGS